jgi:hypothetical protein
MIANMNLMNNKISNQYLKIKKSVNNMKTKYQKYASVQHQIFGLVCLKQPFFIITMKFKFNLDSLISLNNVYNNLKQQSLAHNEVSKHSPAYEAILTIQKWFAHNVLFKNRGWHD